MATGTQGQAGTAAAGSPRNIGTVLVNGPTYLGQDGQQHQYTGKNAAGQYTYDPNFPPAAQGTGAQVGTSSGHAASAQQAMGSAAVGIFALYLIGVLPVWPAVVILASIIALYRLSKAVRDAAAAGAQAASDAIDKTKKWITDQANKIIPGLGDKIGGLLTGLVITVVAGGITYYLFRDHSGRLVIVRADQARTRANPPRIRHRRIRRLN